MIHDLFQALKNKTSLRRTAEESRGSRIKKTLLGKTEWFRKKKKKEDSRPTGGSTSPSVPIGEQEIKYRTVLFVEYTNDGELAARLREQLKRLAPLLGFGVKVVEKAGRSLRSCFPLTTLWDGAPCGRAACITCTQGAEIIPPCSRKSVMYENICKGCNKGAGGKREVESSSEIPSIYVGETSRTLQERGLEHQRDARNQTEKSHMFKHRELHHCGEQVPFILKPVSFHRTALSRQIAEAVRIRRRGGEGAILNSKGEFSRCHISRLQLEEVK